MIKAISNIFNTQTDTKQAKLDTFTENGEPAFSTTSDKNLDLFSLVNREAEVGVITSRFIDAWNENSVLATKILLNFRSARTGKGEKKITYVMMNIIKQNFIQVYKDLLPYFVNMGYWKDLLYLCEESENTELEVDMFVNQLIIDMRSENPSLCAKWAPSEGSKYHNIYKKIILKLGMTPRNYRKLLSELRLRINTIEKNMSTKKFDLINFEQIPSKAHMIHRKALKRDTNYKKESSPERVILKDRYLEYLDSLKKGNAVVKIAGLQPHEITEKLMNGSDQLLEAQWEEIVNTTKSLQIFENALAIVDVSSSMSGQPMSVAIALGLLISECATGIWSNKVITFHENPEFVKLSGHIVEKLKSIRGLKWGGSTDIEKVFDKILDLCVKNNLKEGPKKLFIFTDMQFNEIKRNSEYTKTFEIFSNKFKKHGYQLPQIICWNLRTVSAVPFQSESTGVALMSGFSNETLKCFLTGTEISPLSIMMNAIKDVQVPQIPKNLFIFKE